MEDSWIADYVFEGIQETRGVYVKTLLQMFTHKSRLYTATLQPLIYINNIHLKWIILQQSIFSRYQCNHLKPTATSCAPYLEEYDYNISLVVK